MIGLIGPEDSVELVMSVATEGGYADEIVPRSYTHADQAGAIARELDQICPVLLFTGRIPYLLAKESRQLNSELQFISHSGTDLYRCIARVLIDKHGIMPAVSIDTIEKSTVVSSFSEMGLPEPTVLLVDDAADAAASGGIHDVVNFHREQAESGRAAAAMTCLAEVSIELSKMKIPVWRVEHTKVNVREALQRARLSEQLLRSRSAQLAIAIFQIDSQSLSRADIYEREVAKLHVHQRLLELARKNGGRVTALEAGAFSITTSRGAIDVAITRQLAGHASFLDALDLDVEVRAGVGIGDTYVVAESNAKQALGLAVRGRGTHVVFPDGRVHSATSSSEASVPQLEKEGSVLGLADKLGLGPLSVRRLLVAFNHLNHESFTAQQLADAYGVQPRSARRFLAALSSAGFAEVTGVWTRPSAGRPQTFYRIDMKGLIKSLGSTSEIGSNDQHPDAADSATKNQ
jgi:hypothetical protein